MKLPSIVLLAATLLVGSATAQEPAENAEKAGLPPATVEPMERVIVFDSSAESSPSDLRPAAESSKPTAADLRQARALYESEQRVKRLESHKWRGYEPLRPNWPMTPVMTSRYPARRTIYVPVYFWMR